MKKTAKTIADIYREDPARACRLALRRTAKTPWGDRLEEIDTLLGTHGTEALRGDWQNGYWCDVAAVYCNTGDTCAPTVIHVRGDGWNPAGRFLVSTLGDFAESSTARRLGIL